jgi:hypothetical protein
MLTVILTVIMLSVVLLSVIVLKAVASSAQCFKTFTSVINQCS